MHCSDLIVVLTFRKFITNGVEARKSASARLASRQGALRLNRSGTVAEEMGLVSNFAIKSCAPCETI
jgi:hypothetical protein